VSDVEPAFPHQQEAAPQVPVTGSNGSPSCRPAAARFQVDPASMPDGGRGCRLVDDRVFALERIHLFQPRNGLIDRDVDADVMLFHEGPDIGVFADLIQEA
jgi:hypothetical protein